MGVHDSPSASRWYRLSPLGEPTRPRCSHTATHVAAANALFVVGGGMVADGDAEGEEVTFTHFGDVHRLNLRTMTWDCPLPEHSGTFTPRRGHSAALHEPTNRILTFSGMGCGRASDSLSTRLLDDVQVLHTMPEPRWEQP